MNLFGPNNRPLAPSRPPEPRVTERFLTDDVGHTTEELRVCALSCGVSIRIEPHDPEQPHYNPALPAQVEVEVSGRERDVTRYMDAVKRWSAARE